MSKQVRVWGRLIRITHWYLVVAFFLNYFVLDAGGNPHQILGYVAFCAVILRIGWGVMSKKQGSFATISLGLKSFALHFTHLKNRNVPINAGHNPVGWIMILATWTLFIGLAVTGFMLEETDYFFGSSLVENIHSIFSDVLYGLVLLHIAAVFIVAWWGRVSLIRPMLTGWRSFK